MKQYLCLLKDILENGEDHDDRTGVGTLSVFGRQIRHSMKEGFPILTTKKLPLRWIAEELKWFLSGSTNEKELSAKGVDIWKEWATPEQTKKFGRVEGDLGPIYGKLWRHFPIGLLAKNELPYEEPSYVDQISELIRDINNSPNSRRLIVSGWHPFYQKRVALPPCHTLWQVKVHKDKGMSLHLYARSIDSFLGLPFNIASYGLLLSLIAEFTGHTPKDLIISFGDVHIYKNHIDQVKEQLLREPRPLPSLVLEIGSLTDFDFELLRYDPYPAIKAEVAV